MKMVIIHVRLIHTHNSRKHIQYTNPHDLYNTTCTHTWDTQTNNTHMYKHQKIQTLANRIFLHYTRNINGTNTLAIPIHNTNTHTYTIQISVTYKLGKFTFTQNRPHTVTIDELG